MKTELKNEIRSIGIDLFAQYEVGELAEFLGEAVRKFGLSEVIDLGVNLSRESGPAAQRFFQASVLYSPATPLLWRSLGHCEKSLGNFKEAADAFLKAFELESLAADILEAGICALEVLIPSVAVGCAERALALGNLTSKERAIAHFLVGRSLVLTGRFNDSRAHLLDALDSDPSLAPAAEYLLVSAANCADLAAVTNLIRQMNKAGWLNGDLIQSVLTIFAQKSHYASVLDVFEYSKERIKLPAVCYHLAIESARATRKFELAYELTEVRKKNFPDFSNLGTLVSEIHTLGQLARVVEKEEAIGQFVRLVSQPECPKVSLNPWLLFSFLDDPRLLLEAAKNYSEEVVGSPNGLIVEGEFPVQNPKAPAAILKNKRPTIAFFGCEFRRHPVAECLRPLLRFEDRKCDVMLFSNHFYSDDVTDELKGYTEGFIDCSKFDFDAIKSATLRHGVDILIDLSVHTAGGRPDFFSKRLAPVQINYLGFSGTSGCPGYDFIIGDEFLTPVEESYLYSEDIIRLDNPLLSMNFSAFSGGDRVRDREALGISRLGAGGPVVFGLLAQPYKITKPLLGAIARILVQTPGSRLMLPEKNFPEMKDLFRGMGVDSASLIKAEFKPSRRDHLSRLSACDLLLDTFPYNAHSLAADAISAGTPVLALAGSTFASRVSGSLMSSLGLKNLVVSSLSEYERVGIELGSNPNQLEEIRGVISAAVGSRDYALGYAQDFYEKLRKLI